MSGNVETVKEADGSRAYKYSAFISYSHKDAKSAAGLQKALEMYRIPRRLAPRAKRINPKSRRLGPAFRDSDELPTLSDLSNSIRNALNESEYLIVVCSPRSATSRWVNEEILTFKRLGRSDRILCLIIDGEPNASDKAGEEGHECFPPALRFTIGADGNLTGQRTEPMAADIRPGNDSKKKALLRLVAGMTGLSYSQLYDRDRKRNAQIWTNSSLLAVAISTVAAFLYLIPARRASDEERRRRAADYATCIDEARNWLSRSRPDLATNALWRAPEEARNWEWGALLVMSEPNLLTLHTHFTQIDDAAFENGGERIRTTSRDSTVNSATKCIEEWDARSGARISQQLERWIEPSDSLLTVKVAGNTITVNDKLRNRSLTVFSKDASGITTTALSADGRKLFAAFRSGRAAIWDFATGKPLSVIDRHGKPYTYALFSHRGTEMFARTGYEDGDIWNVPTGVHRLHMALRHLSSITRYVSDDFTFSPDDSKISWLSDYGVVLWDIAKTGRPMRLEGHTWVIYSIEFSPDSKLALTCSGDGTARLWNAETGAQLRVCTASGEPVRSAHFSPNGMRFLTTSDDGCTRLWDTRTGAQLAAIRSQGDSGTWGARWSSDGRLILTWSSAGQCNLYCTHMLEPVRIPCQGSLFWDGFCFDRTGNRLAVIDRGRAKVVEAATGSEIATLRGDRYAKFSPDGSRIITGSSSRVSEIWDASNYRKIAELRVPSMIDQAYIAPDNKHAFVNREVAESDLWDITSSTVLPTSSSIAAQPLTVDSFCDDGSKYVTTSSTGQVVIWLTEQGRKVYELSGAYSGCDDAVFNPVGTQLAALWNYHSVRVWNADDRTVKYTIPNQSYPHFSPNGRYLATISPYDEISIWNSDSGSLVSHLMGHGDKISREGFSPNSSRLVSAALDGFASVWDPMTGKDMLTLPVRMGRVAELAMFSPDGTRVAIKCADNDLLVWQAAPFLKDSLPGRSDSSWEDRYHLWKQQWARDFK